MTEAQEKYRQEVLKELRRQVEMYSDCTEPGKPVYHDLWRLSHKHPSFTGYPNATPVAKWSEQKRLWYWAILKARMRRCLREFEQGKPKPRKRREPGRPWTTRARLGSVKVLHELLQRAEPVGLTVYELHERLYGRPPKHKRDVNRVQRLIGLLRDQGTTVNRTHRYTLSARSAYSDFLNSGTYSPEPGPGQHEPRPEPIPRKDNSHGYSHRDAN